MEITMPKVSSRIPYPRMILAIFAAIIIVALVNQGIWKSKTSPSPGMMTADGTIEGLDQDGDMGIAFVISWKNDDGGCWYYGNAVYRQIKIDFEPFFFDRQCNNLDGEIAAQEFLEYAKQLIGQLTHSSEAVSAIENAAGWVINWLRNYR